MENVEQPVEKTVLLTCKKQSIDKNDSGNRKILRETGTPFRYTLYYEIQYIQQQGKPAQKIYKPAQIFCINNLHCIMYE